MTATSMRLDRGRLDAGQMSIMQRQGRLVRVVRCCKVDFDARSVDPASNRRRQLTDSLARERPPPWVHESSRGVVHELPPSVVETLQPPAFASRRASGAAQESGRASENRGGRYPSSRPRSTTACTSAILFGASLVIVDRGRRSMRADSSASSSSRSPVKSADDLPVDVGHQASRARLAAAGSSVHFLRSFEAWPTTSRRPWRWC